MDKPVVQLPTRAAGTLDPFALFLVPKLSFGTALPSKLCFTGLAAVPSSGTVVEAKLRRHGIPKWNFGTRGKVRGGRHPVVRAGISGRGVCRL